MGSSSVILKEESTELPVPFPWRQTLKNIVDRIREGKAGSKNNIRGLQLISERVEELMAKNIAAYGDQLVSLPDESWSTSVYIWMRGYWDVLIDLYTRREGASDLVLHVRVREDGEWFSFEILSIHVP